MKRTATFLVILASLLAALLAIGAASNQTKIVQLIGGETAEIQCTGKKLAIRRMNRTQVVASCVPAEMPTPPQAPTDTLMPTDMPVPLIGGETVEIQCVGKKLAIRRISKTQVVASCVPAEMPTPPQAPTDMPALTSTPTETPVPTETPTSTPTETPVPTKTATNTPTPTETPVPTETPTSTPTETPVPTKTATNTPTPTDMPVPPTSEGVPRYGLFEMPLPFGEYPHPYYFYDPLDAPENDPGRQSPYGIDGVTVDAFFTAPSGGEMVVPCFWDGEQWVLRAALDEVGTWWWYATAESEAGVVRYPESGLLNVEVATSDNPGYIRVSERDSRWFAFDNGEPFIPLSAGSLQFPLPPYDQSHPDKIREAAEAGANFARVWLNNYGYAWVVESPPEGNPPPDEYSVTYGTHINQEGVQQIDEIVMAAQESGVYLQLCDVSSAEWNWDYSTSADPWVPNRVSPNDERYIKYWKNNFRYKVARWGWATSVLAWEHWNELGHVDPGSGWWGFYEEYVPYQKATDPYGHLLTTSQNVQAYSPGMWSQLMDYANVHEGLWQRDKPELYEKDIELIYRVAQYLRREDIDCQSPNELNYKSCANWAGPDKPWTWGEYMAITTDEAYKGNGDVDTRSLSGVSGERFRHNRVWAGLHSPLLITPVEWFEWATDVNVRKAGRDAVRWAKEYLTDFDPTGVAFAATSNLSQPNYTGPTIQASNSRLYVMSAYWLDGANVWISSEDLNWLGPENPTPASGTFELIGLSPGHYRLTWFNTWTGETTDGGTVTTGDGTLTIAVDDLVEDVALRVRVVEGIYAAPGDDLSALITGMSSGETLVLGDGTYRSSMTVNDKDNITIRAEHDGQARIDGQGVRRPCQILNSSNIVVEGVVCHHSNDMVFHISESNDVHLSRVSAYEAGPDYADHVFEIYRSNRVTLEDCAASGRGRNMYLAFESDHITFRRCWGRYVSSGTELGAGWMQIYGTSDALIENCVGTRKPSDIYANLNQYWYASWNRDEDRVDRNRTVGSVFHGYDYHGLTILSENQQLYDNGVENSVFIGNDTSAGYGIPYTGIFQRADDDALVDRVTLVNHRAAVDFSPHGAGYGVPCFNVGGELKNSSIVNSSTGIVVGGPHADCPNISVNLDHHHNNLYNVSTRYAGTGQGDGEIFVNPGYDIARYGEGAYLMVPDVLKGRGENGADIGAEVLYFENGEPMWPWPMEERICIETAELLGEGISVTYEESGQGCIGGLWRTLEGVYAETPTPTDTSTPRPTSTDTPTATPTPVVTPISTPVPQPGGWNQLGGNPQHTSYSAESLPDNLELLWQWNGSCSDGSDCRPGDPDIGWSFYAPPDAYAIAGGGNLYLPSYEGLWAISQQTGKTVWHNADIMSVVSAAYDNGSLFVAGEHGLIYQVDVLTGVHEVIFHTGADVAVAPALANDRLYIASDSTLYALDLDGNLIWQYSTDSLITTPASVSTEHGRVVFGLRNLNVLALDLDGNLIWERNPTQRQPGWDPIYSMPTYYYDHGWIVIADGKAFVKMHVPKRVSYQPPGGNYPTTGAEVRAYLAQHPEQQTLFALNLSDGSDAYDMPLPVGPMGIETIGTTERGWTLGPMPAIDEELGVAWMPWRAADNNQTPDQWKFSREGGICELDLVTGDCRYVNFYGQPNLGIVVDGAGGTIATSPGRFHYPHWMYMSSWLVTNRNVDGQSWDTRIQTQREVFVLNRVEPQTGYNCVFSESMWCPGGMGAFCDGGYFSGGGYGIFWDVTDPPYACSSAYSDGYMPRQVIVDSGRLYYQLNGSTIIAFGGL